MRKLALSTAVAVVALLVPPSVSGAADAADIPSAVGHPDRGGDTIALGRSANSGFEILTVRNGAWEVVASLAVPGVDTDQWIGEACITGSGRFAAAAFAPRQYATVPYLRDQGAFAATVDLRNGRVWLVPERVALEYHTPGCGVGDSVAFTRYLGSNQAPTDILVVDARDRSIDRRQVRGQITSVVPSTTGPVGIEGTRVVRIEPTGDIGLISRVTHGRPFDLHPSADGGFDLLALDGKRVAALHLDAEGEFQQLAAGNTGELRIAPGQKGVNRLVGLVTTQTSDIEVVHASPLPLAVSLDGQTVVERFGSEEARDELVVRNAAAVTGAPVAVQSAVGLAPLETNETRSTPQPTSSPSLPPVTTTTLLPPPPSPPTPKCAIAPNDYRNQVLQPVPAQVEWAAHRAVRGQLNFTRPANWQLHGLPAYSPGTEFPRPSLPNNARIPVQLLLGVLATESNLNQASYHALPGVPGNPLIGNYWGVQHDSNGYITGMDFAKADCGYGVGQITDHMTATDTYYSDAKKLMISSDYAANIAVAVQILIDKWNQLAGAGIIANTGDPNIIEDWYFAVWAYNTGFYPQSGSNPWGVGWTNNPANASYPPDRPHYLRTNYDDSRWPHRWPYQEQVMGWAEVPQRSILGGAPKYTPTQIPLILPEDYFFLCDASNQCSPDHIAGTDPDGAGPLQPHLSYCQHPDRKCWWHKPVTWAGMGTRENAASYTSGAPEPPTSNPQPPDCQPGQAPILAGPPGDTALPSTAVVVDELPNTSWNLVGCPASARNGSFNLQFASDSSLNPTGQIDFHQVGTGDGGHFWFAHTLSPSRTFLKVTGTWKPPGSVVGWQKIYVHIPTTGADTSQADYQINTGLGKTYHRVVNQRWNKNGWFDLGSFALGSNSSVVLSNVTYGDWRIPRPIDVAFDAIAYVPTTKPLVSYVALGDSYSAGEGAEPYFENTDVGKSTAGFVNACHRSSQGYPYLVMDHLRDLRPGPAGFHFAACSGARLLQVVGQTTPTGKDEQWGEVPQLKQGWLDDNTTHVTISIGGNDAGFADILKGCMMTVRVCTAPDFRLERDGQTDPEPLITYEPKVINALRQPLQDMLSRVKQLAPNAVATLVGYPHVITTGVPGFPCSTYHPETLQWFAEMGDLMTQVMTTAAANTATRMADVRAMFAGHEACTTTAEEWIHAVIAYSSSGSGRDTPGSGTFHPKASGHANGYEPMVYSVVTRP